jgi:RES domain-containing protein
MDEATHDLALAVSRAPTIDLEGEFERHVSRRWAGSALEGSVSGGRWGSPGTFPVIYLARPTASVIVEAYRHLVDPTEGMTGERVRGRVCARAAVSATNILDLRSDEALLAVGLTREDLLSDVDDYAACQRVAQVAHQLTFHGILAPAATDMGEVLALFPRHLPTSEVPVAIGEPQIWATLPADPRIAVRAPLRLVQDDA